MIQFSAPRPNNKTLAKSGNISIIIVAIGVSSNGRTRDFGSLYHGSNPCAPTTLRLYEASCGGPHKRSSYREVVSPEVLTKGGLINVLCLSYKKYSLSRTKIHSPLRGFVWQATQDEKHRRSSVHRSLGIGGQE